MNPSVQFYIAKNKIYGIAILLGISLLFLCFLLEFNGLYGQDGYEYLRFSRELRQYFYGGNAPAGMVFPMYYSFIGSLLSLMIPGSIVGMQLVSIIAFLIGFIILYRLIRFINKDADENIVIIYLLLFYVLSPYVFRFSVLVMSDMLGLMFCLASVYYGVKYIENRKASDVILVTLFTALSLLTRAAAAGLLLIPALFIGYQFTRNFKWPVFLAIAIIILILLLPDFIIRHKLFIFSLSRSTDYEYLKNIQFWNIANWFKADFHTIDGDQNFHQPNIVYAFFNVFHPAYLFAGIPLLIFIRREDFTNKGVLIISLPIVFYALFLAGFYTQNMRYLLMSFPLILVILFPAFTRLLKFIRGKKICYPVLSVLLLLQLLFSGYTLRTVLTMNRNDRMVATEMHSYPDRTIYTFGIDQALKAYGITNPVINIWEGKISAINPNSIALIDTNAINQQFAGQTINKNWTFIKQYGHPLLLKNLPESYQLFTLKP
jgi:hypothetical protein